MGKLWILLLIVLTLIEMISTGPSSLISNEDYRLTKSLGYVIRKRFASDLNDARISQEYTELYQDMMKVSQEIPESFESEEEALEGRELQVMKGDSSGRRRKSAMERSTFGRRRARLQAHRRDKLHSQGLRSHRRHMSRYHADSADK